MTPLVLVPGLLCDERLWGDLPAALAPRAVQHALPTQAATLPELAAGVLATAPERFALAGLSLGGIVAMEVLAQAPDRVERLALLDTNPFAETETIRQRRLDQIERALAGDLQGIVRDEMKPQYLADPGNRPVLDLCMAMARRLGPEVFRRQSLALRDRPDQSATLARYRKPTLILMGEQDRLCPRDRHDRMHALMPHARLVIIPAAGHLPPLEQPAPTLAAFKEWLHA